jgi:hypothetical protein
MALVSGSILAFKWHLFPDMGVAISWFEIWRTRPLLSMNTTAPLLSEQLLLQVAVPVLWSTHLALQTQPVMSIELFLSLAHRRIARQKIVTSSQAIRFILPPEGKELPIINP